MADPVPTPSPIPSPAPVDPAPAPIVADPAPAPAPADPAPAPVPADPTPEHKGDWPDDWREKYAGEDPAALKRLQRYGSPKAALDALFNAQKKISSGELTKTPAKDAPPEEVAAWREANGIPTEASGYDITLKDGLIPSEADKPIVDAFLQRAHETNMRPEQVKEALGFYFEEQERQLVEQHAYDIGVKEACEESLRAEWGADYKRNLMAVNELLSAVPGGVQDQLLNGRLADGTPIASSPEVIRWLTGLARELNPIATVVPGSGTNALAAVDSELGTLRKMMGDTKSEYWKGPNAAKMQARYRELTAAKQKGRV